MIARLNLGPIHLQFFPAVDPKTNKRVPSVVARAIDETANHDMTEEQLTQLITDLNLLRANIQNAREGL